MKKYILILLVIFVQNSLYSQNEKSKLINLYESFEDDIKNDKIDHFKTLFYNDSVPLNTVVRTNDSLLFLSHPFSNWSKFLSTKTFPYETRISNAEYEIDDNVAYTIASFDEFAKEKLVSKGTDLFLYVKNKNNWTLVSLNGSATLTANTKMNHSPVLKKKKVKQMVRRSLNNELSNTFLNSHISAFSQIYVGDQSEATDWKSQTLNSYFKEIKNANESWKLRNINVQIIDKHMALVKLKIKITKGTITKTSSAYISLLAKEQSHPIITSIILMNSYR